jgi:CheY-like chemotaxis protein
VPVLIVDDNATNRSNLHELLAHWGMRPSSVGGTQTALATLRQARDLGAAFPLVLLDAYMPGDDGFTLAAQINQDSTLAGATIMLLTTGSQLADASRGRDIGMATHLTKPVTPAELWNAVHITLGAPMPTRVPAVNSRPTEQEHRQHLRILLAEDNVVNQQVAVRMLQKWGHTVTVVNTGKAVLAALAQQSFDLVLMDVQMPEMDGLTATAAIRAQERTTGARIPIIAMTANAMQGDAEQCIAAGMDAYIAKPMRAADLDTTLTRWSRDAIGSQQLPSVS